MKSVVRITTDREISPIATIRKWLRRTPPAAPTHSGIVVSTIQGKSKFLFRVVRSLVQTPLHWQSAGHNRKDEARYQPILRRLYRLGRSPVNKNLEQSLHRPSAAPFINPMKLRIAAKMIGSAGHDSSPQVAGASGGGGDFSLNSFCFPLSRSITSCGSSPDNCLTSPPRLTTCRIRLLLVRAC